MATPYRTTRRVEFRDTDAGGLVHFTTFFVYMEEVEHELIRHLGLSILTRDATSVISWPRVKASCEFLSPVRFEDVMDVEVWLERLGTRSVSYAFRFLHEGHMVAVGHVTAVCCRMVTGQSPQSTDIPPAFVERFRPLVMEPPHAPAP